MNVSKDEAECAQIRDKVKEIIKRNKGIAMAYEILVEISNDEVERARLESECRYLDMQRGSG